jgi:hypothetical protein
MNGHLDSMNLFRGYSQEENAQTHAFLAFLNFLLQVLSPELFETGSPGLCET